MAATNFTPIQLYFSTTASAVPVAANLAQGELAINITDGKLYYEDNAGAVQVIATKGAGTIGGSTTQIQYNNAGALAGNAAMVFNNSTNVTTLTTLNLTNALGAIYGGTAQSTYTQGDFLYASASNTLSKLGIGTVNYILTSTGTVPQWVAPTSITVNTATNLAGGAAGSVPYQSGVATTTFLAIGAANRVMTSTGTAPQWVTSLTGLTGVSSSSITNTSLTSGRVVIASTAGLEADSANLTFDGTTLSSTGYSTTGLSTLVKTVKIGDSSFNGVAVFAAATPAKLYMGTGTVTDVTSAISATNAIGAIASLGITPIAATNTSVTYTNASTLYIAGAPSAGTNVTLTNPYSLYVAAGAAYFGGAVTVAGSLSLAGVTVTSLTDSGLTSGRVTYAGTGGLLQDSANLTFNGTTLTANTIGAFTLGGTIAGGGNQINNVIIGTTTPLAGNFSTLSASGTVTLTNSSVNQLVLTGAGTAATRIQVLRGTDDSTQSTQYGWNGQVTERSAPATIAQVQGYNFVFRGTTDATPLALTYNTVTVTGTLTTTGSASVGTTNASGAIIRGLGASNANAPYYLDADGPFGGSPSYNSILGFALYTDSGARYNSHAEIQCIADNNYSGSLAFFTQNPGTYPNTVTERARITSSGYGKFSNTGTYQNSSATTHEFDQSANSVALNIYATNASYTNEIVQILASRNTSNNTFYPITYYNLGASAYRFTVADSGSIGTAGSIALGSTLPPTSGIGVQFPATQSASSDANTLDDYEEGFFTATVAPETSGTITLNSTVDKLAYTKIGRVVYVQGLLEISSVSSPVGTVVYIQGLPFTTADLDEYAGRGGTAFMVKSIVTGINIFEGQTRVEVNINASTLVATDQFYVSFNYIAA